MGDTITLYENGFRMKAGIIEPKNPEIIQGFRYSKNKI